MKSPTYEIPQATLDAMDKAREERLERAYPNLPTETMGKGNPEKDPSGKDSHQAGAKLDAGKVMPSLILSAMPRALMEVAKVGTEGARKYSKNGWLEVDDGIARYTDAMDRHRLKEYIEGPMDLDFKAMGVDILHAAQVAWNAMARLELMLRLQEYNKE